MKEQSMHLVEKSFVEQLKVISQHSSFKSRYRNINVMVSGGVDSMVLLHLLYKYKKEYGLAINVIHVLFDDVVNFKAVDDLIYDTTYTYKVSYTKYMVNSNNKPIKKTEARALLKEYGTITSSDAIFTAHHASDQAETILYRIFAGRTGIEGLKGMDVICPYITPKGTFTYIKPLLQVTKDEIYDYAKTHKVKYIEDLSNLDTVFSDRNFIRHRVIPLLEERFNISQMVKGLHVIQKSYVDAMKTDEVSIEYTEKGWKFEEMHKLTEEQKLFLVKSKIKEEFGIAISKRNIDFLKVRLADKINCDFILLRRKSGTLRFKQTKDYVQVYIVEQQE